MNKGPDAYRTIGEASKEVGVEPYVLRFWETKFSQLSPVKRSGGRRFYRPSDIDKLRIIKSLLYDNGLTIKGAVEQLKKIDITDKQSISNTYNFTLTAGTGGTGNPISLGVKAPTW